jgi:type II restriction endonuclease EcoO109I-like protein
MFCTGKSASLNGNSRRRAKRLQVIVEVEILILKTVCPGRGQVDKGDIKIRALSRQLRNTLKQAACKRPLVQPSSVTIEFIRKLEDAAAQNVVAVSGCCYGHENQPDKGDYLKLCGQRFWGFISGNRELYTGHHRAARPPCTFCLTFRPVRSRR